MLDALPDTERKRIYDIATTLTALIHEDLDPYEEFDSIRFSATALTNAVQNPDLPIDHLRTLAKLTLWIFTIDNIIDEERWSKAKITESLQLYEQIACGQRLTDWFEDPLGLILSDVMRDFQVQPQYPYLREIWADAFIRMLRGMLFESSSSVDTVEWDDYMHHAVFSIGVPTYIIATWMFQDDTLHSDPSRWMTLIDLSATCIRLANDLRTYEKECKEGNCNSVMIRQATWVRSGLPIERSHQMAIDEIRSMITENIRKLSLSCSPKSPLTTAILRVTEFSVALYEHYDFHLLADTNVTGSELQKASATNS